jgi:FtsP/CotA-like multicopper oxidase with cupredoxin domain
LQTIFPFFLGALFASGAFLIGFSTGKPKKKKLFAWGLGLLALSGLVLPLTSLFGKPSKITPALIAKPLSSIPTPLPAEARAQAEDSNALLHEKALVPTVLPDGTREYSLSASAFPWQVYPGLALLAWGFNHQIPGPLIRLRVGEHVRFRVANHLPQPITLHWHGLPVPITQDGVPGVTQKTIPTEGEFTYQFTVTPDMAGTHLYHSHVNDDVQMDKGLHGVLIVDPAAPQARPYDVEAVYEMSSFKAGTETEEENTFAFNGKAFPEAPVLNVGLGKRILLRLINASAEQPHVMHLHGYNFQVVALDGNPLDHPYRANSILLGPAQTADVAFTASRPGNWMFQCHFLDHVMNPVSKEVRDEMREDASITPMGGLMTFINVLAEGPVDQGYEPAGSITHDPTCSDPSRR